MDQAFEQPHDSATEQEQPERKHHLGIFPIFSFILLLPILYMLSMGPALWVLPQPAFKGIYEPLIRFESHCAPLDRFITWYMEKVWKCGLW